MLAICEYEEPVYDSRNASTSFKNSYKIESADSYTVLFIKCGTSPRLTGTYTLDMTNPGFSFLKHLDAFHMNLFYVLCADASAWTLMIILWVVNVFRKGPTTKFFYIILLYPVSRLLYLCVFGVQLVQSSDYGDGDYSTYNLANFRDLISIFNSLIMRFILFMIAKGYCVVRTDLSPVEIRSIFGKSIISFVSLLTFLV